ncbi:OprD family outer membrane porin [bacterium]|nr:OprD family outer membrane porin [bacterium]MBU1958156.1 OprD family outer membrane porin [bacterium]
MKHITLSFATIALLSSTAVAADSLAEAFTNGKTSGQIRTFYIDRTYSGTIVNNRNSLAVGGNLGFETAAVNGLSVGTKFYTTNGLDIHDGPRTSANYDPSLYGDDFTSYSMVGEAYINYKQDNTNIKFGRQKLDTPLAGSDDARMLPNLFEAVVISNTDVENTTLVGAHVSRESVGTFGNVYGAAGQLSLQSGYGLGYKQGTNGRFADMGAIALGDAGADTLGVTAAAAIYKGVPGLTLQAWDYYAHDILNAIYLQGDYGWNCLLNDAVKMNASAQLISQSEVGDKLAGNVDSQYMGVKLGATAGALSGSVAYSTTGSNDNTVTNGGILTPWGGIPAFTQGMVTRHMFFADTDTTKVAATYNLKNVLDADVKATAYHVSFDVGAKNTYQAGQAWTAKESGFDIQYNPAGIKNLNLRVRANYPTDFAPGVDWDEYRLIANYNF